MHPQPPPLLLVTASARPSLIERSEIPPHLQFNKYVLRHYRSPSDWKGCLNSLFYLHNETVNVWSELLPAAAFAVWTVLFMGRHAEAQARRSSWSDAVYGSAAADELPQRRHTHRLAAHRLRTKCSTPGR